MKPLEMSNSHIKKLTLHDNYNYPLLELPHKLTNLTLNWKFNQIITNYPNTIYTFFCLTSFCIPSKLALDILFFVVLKVNLKFIL